LTVLESGGTEDVQAQGRVTCLANARPLDAGDAASRDRYFRYFPSARQYEQTHGFDFFFLELVRIRFIGGFGQIFWVTPEEFRSANPFSPAQESRILDHMNADHAAALRGYAGGRDATMCGIDGEGFDMLVAGQKVRTLFDAPVSTMEEARQALVAMAKRSA
jgi:putative heme iron utilization protein